MRNPKRAATRVALALLPPLVAFAVVAHPFGASNAVSASSYDWLQFNGDAQHGGNNTLESILSSATVSGLQRMFQTGLPGVADGAPAYLSGVTTANGTQDLLYVTTKTGTIAAVDAHNGSLVWSMPNPAGTCRINGGSNVCYTTSSPVIDPNRQFVYSFGLDGKVHKYAAGSGVETLSGGWPEIATLKGQDEKGSSALSFATAQNGTTYLYVANAGYPGDNGNYQGHVTAINLSTGAQEVFNTLCANLTVHLNEPGGPAGTTCDAVQSAVWARDGVVYDAQNNRLFLATGNGDFVPSSHSWGDSVLAINPDATGKTDATLGYGPLDSYTPTNFQSLQNNDADLGSTGPALLPTLPGSTVTHVAVQSGKDSKLRLINLDNLSGQNALGKTGGEVGSIVNVPQGGEVKTTIAVWTNPSTGVTWIFVGSDNGLSALTVTVVGGTPQFNAIWTHTSGHRSSPLVANGVLYAAGDNIIEALDPVTGNQLWHNTTVGGNHWESPIVANGMLYVTDENGKISGFSLPSTNPTATLTSTATPTATSTATRTATVTSTATATNVATSTATATLTRTATATAGSGLLTSTNAADSSAINLTSEGTDDWAHWGLTTAASFDHKAAVTQQIPQFTLLNGATVTRFTPFSTSFTWTDGTPTASATTPTGDYVSGAGHGFQLVLPADSSTTRTLKLHVGYYKAQGQLTATLSDNSATPLNISLDNVSGLSMKVLSISYRAGSPGQTLTLTWSIQTDHGGGNLSLDAASLSSGQPGATATATRTPIPGGVLQGALAPDGAAVNLSSQGALDWAHWGLTSAASFDHKAGVTSQISNYTLPSGGTPLSANVYPGTFSWTDGTPTISATTATGDTLPGQGHVFRITVPADNLTTHTLKVYLGSSKAQASLRAVLSDNSAPAYMVSGTNSTGSSIAVATLSFRSATPGQTLTITMSLDFDYGGGSVWLQAATLS